MKCFDKRVLIGLGVLGLGVLVVSPRLATGVLPLLLVLACPLSMLLMMPGMRAGHRRGAKAAQDVAHAADREAEVARMREEIDTLKAELQQANRARTASGADPRSDGARR